MDGVEADKAPERVSWLKQQAEKTKRLAEELEDRETNEGEK